MTEIVRIGCLGAARITPPAIVEPATVHGGVALQSIAARDVARAEKFAADHGFKTFCESYDELVADPDVDLVYNALPINLHAEWTIRALEAGKHVLCEKPLAMNAAEATAMLDAAAGKRLIEALHYRYHPTFAHYLRWLAEGRIGKLRRIEANFSVPIPDNNGKEIRHLPATGGGSFMDLGCYPLSWALMSTQQEPETIEAEAILTSRGVDESMTAVLTFADGLKAHLESSMAMHCKQQAWLKVIGDKGEIQFDNPLAPQSGSRLTVITNDSSETASKDRVSTYFYQLDAVVRGLQTGEQLPTEGAAMIRQQRTIDAIYAAAGLGHLRSALPESAQ
ncbi:MAG: Gfo/Idh/MocA family oxidoreductase [Woeseia sp.]